MNKEKRESHKDKRGKNIIPERIKTRAVSKTETRSGTFDKQQGGEKLSEQKGVGEKRAQKEAGWFQSCGEVHGNIRILSFFQSEMRSHWKILSRTVTRI